MTGTREDFLATARSAADLLREPAVVAAWREPSALPEFSVGGLAGHLAFQVLTIPRVLTEPEPQEQMISLVEHYGRALWVGADLDAEINVRIRDGGEAEAAEGPEALVARVDAAVEELTEALASAPDRPVRISLWGPWSLRLDDFLVTRMMELAVHSDDLAVSVGIATPALPPSAVETVIDLLSRLCRAPPRPDRRPARAQSRRTRPGDHRRVLNRPQKSDWRARQLWTDAPAGEAIGLSERDFRGRGKYAWRRRPCTGDFRPHLARSPAGHSTRWRATGVGGIRTQPRGVARPSGRRGTP